jgi:uncharacterized membrane protein
LENISFGVEVLLLSVEHMWVVVHVFHKVLELNDNIPFGFNFFDTNVLGLENILLWVVVLLLSVETMWVVEVFMVLSNKVLESNINITGRFDVLNSNILGLEKILLWVEVLLLSVETMWVVEVFMVLSNKVLESNINITGRFDVLNSNILGLEKILLWVEVLLLSVETMWVVEVFMVLSNEILESNVNVSFSFNFFDSNVLGLENIFLGVVVLLDSVEAKWMMRMMWVVHVFSNKVLELNVNNSLGLNVFDTNVLGLENIMLWVHVLLDSVEHVWLVKLWVFKFFDLLPECHRWLVEFFKINYNHLSICSLNIHNIEAVRRY